MSIWATLFNSTSTIEKATDAVISTGDKLFYTDEEKAEDRRRQREFFPTLLNAYAPFKIAQRILAIWFSALFGLAFLLGLAMSTFNMLIKYNNPEAVLISLEPLYKIVGAFDLGIIMTVIVGFYFAGGVVDSARRK